MKTYALALRNLLRNRRRSLTTLVAMVVGVVTILVFGGYSRDERGFLKVPEIRRSESAFSSSFFLAFFF